jgi:diguanylate cyclase (GGDEF)-like protein
MLPSKHRMAVDDTGDCLSDIRARVLEALPHGICVLDAQLKVSLCNQRFIDLFKLSADRTAPGASLDALLRQGYEAAGQSARAAEIVSRRLCRRLARQGDISWRWRLADGSAVSINVSRLGGGDLLATCDEIVAAATVSDDLREQHRRFDAALNNMSQGLCMYDADGTMIVCNDKYCSIFYMDPDVVKPGVTMREVFAYGVARGIYPGSEVEDLLARRLATVAKGTNSVYDQKMADGRTIEVLISPMANGAWVGTFEDVTEIRRLELERTAALAKVQERNMLLDATLESMSQGLCVFDANGRLIIRNQRYLDIYGLPEDIAKPGVHVHDLIQHAIEHGLALPDSGTTGRYEEQMTQLSVNKDSLTRRRFADGRIIAVSTRAMAHGGWVSTFEDISERERAAAELRVQHNLFDAALTHMSHGLSMLDKHLNLIVCNTRYLEIYGMSADVVKPGTSMLEIISQSIGTVRQDGNATAGQLFAEYKTRLAAGDHVVHRDLADGRAVKVAYQPLPDGGWVIIHEDVTDKKRAEQHIAYMASHDPLTDLANRTLFQQRMEDGLARAFVGEERLAVLYIDLDNFKMVNDTRGHPVGDRLLREVADRLHRIVSADDTVARLGGDEFAILKVASGQTEVAAFARDLVSTLCEPVAIDDSRIQVGGSIGIAMAPVDGMTATHLMKCADIALYRAKSEGRGTFCFFEPDMDARAQARRSLEQDLRQALSLAQFHLVFQPLVRASTGDLTGFEALLRWDRGAHGPVSPVDFIPIAEETGLIDSIGGWVMREACFEAARWPDPIMIAVNLSPVQFKKPGLVAMITNALASSGLPPQRLELEITEAVLLQDNDTSVAALKQLRALGISISIDDFGVGYSSLSYLRRFPFDKIKIDRSFISDINGEGKNFAIVRAIAELGTSLGVKTVAEGVETEAQFELVRRAGCSELQGYLVSRPQNAKGAMTIVRRSQQADAPIFVRTSGLRR